MDVPGNLPNDPHDLDPEDTAAEAAAEAEADRKDRELQFNTLPNQLTLVRIGMVPLVVGLLFIQRPLWDLAAALLFIAASITDYFDGYYARTRKIVTIYGKLLDPLADKFLVVSALIMLQHLDRIGPVLVMLL